MRRVDWNPALEKALADTGGALTRRELADRLIAIVNTTQGITPSKHNAHNAIYRRVVSDSTHVYRPKPGSEFENWLASRPASSALSVPSATTPRLGLALAWASLGATATHNSRRRPILATLRTLRSSHPEIFETKHACSPPWAAGPYSEITLVQLPAADGVCEVVEAGPLPEDLVLRQRLEEEFSLHSDRDAWLELPTDPELAQWELQRNGIELLAIYLPFHRYLEPTWGIRFFELPLAKFTGHLYDRARSSARPLSFRAAFLVALYSVGCHEFSHYLTEVSATAIEIAGVGGPVYVPYSDRVYNPKYLTLDCVEETVANLELLSNPIMERYGTLRTIMRDLIRPSGKAGPAGTALRAIPVVNDDCYSIAAQIDAGGHAAGGSTRDKLYAQVVQCRARPKHISPIHGILPTRNGQEWTYVRNVTCTMNRSAGGLLWDLLDPASRTP